jgi:hypothetical protein
VLDLVDREALPMNTLVPRDPNPLVAEGFVKDLEDLLTFPLRVGGIPVAPVELVVGTRLLRQKAQDVADIVELALFPTFDREAVRAFVRRCLRAPLPEDPERMFAQADRERAQG